MKDNRANRPVIHVDGDIKASLLATTILRTSTVQEITIIHSTPCKHAELAATIWIATEVGLDYLETRSAGDNLIQFYACNIDSVDEVRKLITSLSRTLREGRLCSRVAIARRGCEYPASSTTDMHSALKAIGKTRLQSDYAQLL